MSARLDTQASLSIDASEDTLSLSGASNSERQSLIADTHLRIESLCQNLIDINPARLQGINKESLVELTSQIYEKLSQTMSEEESLELIKNLLTQTIPDGRMGADSYLPGNDRNGDLTILDSYKGESVLENLASIENTEHLSAMLKILTDVRSIDQGLNNTCSVTCAQSFLAAEDPAIFVSRVTELLRDGVATNEDGSTALSLTQVIPSDERGFINALFQSAMMNAADGGYDVVQDLVAGRVGNHPGLYARQLVEVLNQASGNPHRVIYKGDEDYRPVIDSALDDRRSVIAVVSGIGAGTHAWHDVRIVDRKDGQIYFINPWPDSYIQDGNGIEVIDAASGLCRMSEERFLAQTEYIAYQTNDPADFNFVPDGRDEVGGYTAEVFTVDEDPGFIEHLRRLKRVQETLETKEKKGKN